MSDYRLAPPCVSPTYVERRWLVRDRLIALACDANGRSTGELVWGDRYMPQYRVHYYERDAGPVLKNILVQAVDPAHAKGEAARVLGRVHGVTQSYTSRFLIIEANLISGSLYPRHASANPVFLRERPK